MYMRSTLRSALLSIAIILAPVAAFAQSTCPVIATGAVLTAAQWQSCFTAKQNVLGYAPVNKAGDTMLGRLTTASSTSSAAGFNIPQGQTPTAPQNGDIWTTLSGVFVQINGTTIGPLAGAGGAIAVGVTPITGGTSGRILYNFLNKLGELPTSGSGAVALVNAPTFVGPILGAATATSINGLGITTSTGTLTIANGKTFTASNSITIAGTDASTLNVGTGGTLGTAAFINTGTSGATIPLLNGTNTWGAVQTLPSPAFTGTVTGNATIPNAVLVNSATTVNGQTCTLGASCTVTAAATGITVGTTTVGGGTTTRVLFNNAGTLGEYVISGTGSVAMTTSPAFTTPSLGVATATSINGLTITSSAAGVLTIAAGKTHVVSNGITLAGTDSTTWTGASSNMTLAALNLAGQVLTGGATVTPANLGTISSGTTTVNCGTVPLQYATLNGAFTLAAPAADSSCIIRFTNGASAGTITFSGWTVGSNTGDAYVTTNGKIFDLFVRRINGAASYSWSLIN